MNNSRAAVSAGWHFDNSYARLPEFFFSRTDPTPVRAPEMVIFNTSLAETLGLNTEVLQNSEGAELFAGNQIPEGAEPLAQAYAGHQFGYFTLLGDGRALLLGEQITPRGQRFDIQLKGSGKTPHSRRGDGRAALGPMLREYIISEAMVGLGIPTTRSLAVVTTGETVIRDTVLPGAVLTRVAASHLRVGTFQYAARWGTPEDLRVLADYTLQRHFAEPLSVDNPYLYLLQEVVKRQAALIAQWQLVGFIHGVMNTDNMAISGETIDYGPCAFMDTYDPATVFSSIDTQGRYAYGNQPPIAAWNLARFAETLLPLLAEDKDNAIQLAQEAIDEFEGLYQTNWLNGMRWKLGLFNHEPEDESLIHDLLRIMEEQKADYTNTFRSLTFNQPEGDPLLKTAEFAKWHAQWQARTKRQQETASDQHDLMRRNNPAVIPRNHRVEEALTAANQGDLSVMEELLAVLADPYAHTTKQADYAAMPGPSSCGYQTFCGT
ncbi:YdiU family protein [Dehalobacter sp. DCM]|uniref:protein adenylyltransferase SelO n=1 Tax=Dehalobacter sp. DCM TaxID=2907827 RepID=UPI003082177A|nr:YdiU family protein [Dehalobacter sp. DCM]